MKQFSHTKQSIFLFVFLLLFLAPALRVKAETVYVSDGIDYEEGYIIIGESHAVVSSDAYSMFTDDQHHVIGVKNVTYHFCLDSSQYVDESGGANTFTMSGNLFFVFEGKSSEDADKQTDKEYIYSDGKGNRGIAVKKIHQIMESNPNVKHWNLISYHGAVSALNGAADAPYYISSYKNWMSYEFPKASLYFVSHSTLTKFYKQKRNAYQFDEAIKKAFPSQYFDMTSFYRQRYPQEMYDPDMNPDTIHWNHKTYVELFNHVINKIQSEAYAERCRLLRIHQQEVHYRYLACKNACY